ncbi:MAG: sensor histidine kinase [Rhodospirillaceae bacterium]
MTDPTPSDPDPPVEHFHREAGAYSILSPGSADADADRALAEASDDAELEALRQLNEASAKLWRAESLREGLDQVLVAIAGIAGTDRGAIELYDETVSGFRVYAALGFGIAIEDYRRIPPSPPGSASRRAIESAAPVFVVDTEQEFDAQMLSVARAMNFRSIHAFPIIAKTGVCAGALVVYYRTPTAPRPRIVERVKLYVRQVTEFIERDRIKEAWASSERQARKRASEFEALVNAVPAAIIMVPDAEVKTMMVNREAAKFFGQPPDTSMDSPVVVSELRAQKALDIYVGDQRLEARDRPAQRAARGEEVRGFELEIRFGQAEPRFVYGNATPLRDDGGSVSGSVTAFVEITDRKKMEAQRELLLAEVNHRVKNTLSTVIAIQQQTFAKALSPQEGQRAFERRIRALAQTHDRLAAENWSGVLLQALLEDELAPYRDDRSSNIVVQGAALKLNPRSAVMLGLTFHELAANAAKYGALSLVGGTVKVAWEDVPDDDAILLTWIEQTNKGIQPPTRHGFGRVLLERGIATQLNCKVELSFPATGAACRIILPRTSL